jgi:hypothetical protein
MERRDLYQDDLTEERYPTPGDREDASETQALDPDTPPGDPETDDDDDDDEDDDDDDD